MDLKNAQKVIGGMLVIVIIFYLIYLRFRCKVSEAQELPVYFEYQALNFNSKKREMLLELETVNEHEYQPLITKKPKEDHTTLFELNGVNSVLFVIYKKVNFPRRSSTRCMLIADNGLSYPRTSIEKTIECACTEIIHGEVWMCGGHVDVISSTTNDYSDTSSKGLLIYNPQRDEWRSGPDMTESRIGAVSGVFGGSMVIVGGHGYLPGHYTATDLLSGERFCHETRAWKPISDVPYNINGATACVLNDRLFVIGDRRSKKLLIWNKTTDTWTEGAFMHTTRYGGVCVVETAR